MENELVLVVRAEDQASSVLKRMNDNMSSTAGSVKRYGRATQQMGQQTKQATRQVQSMNLNMKRMVQTIAGASAIYAVSRALREATKAAIDFDEKLHDLWTLSENTWEGMEKVGQSIRNLAYDFPATASEATSAMYEIYSATFKGADATRILEESLEGATAGLSDARTAADMFTTVLNAYGMEAAEVERINDLMFTTIRYGKCVTGDTRILLADGRYKRIDELREGGDVVAWDGESFSSHSATWTDEGVKQIVKLRTKLGREIKTTWNHPYLTQDGWKKVSNLNLGEKIAVPASIPFFGDKEVSTYKAALLGLWIAEGSRRNGTPEITSTEYGDDICYWAEEIGCAAYNREKRDGFAPIYALPSEDRNQNTPNPFLDWLREMGLVGEDRPEKHIPDEVFEWSRDSLVIFLRWLLNSDGWLCDMSNSRHGFQLGFCSQSKRLVEDVSHLMLRFGVVGTIRQRKQSKAWVWEVNHYQGILQFAKEIGIDRPANDIVFEYTPNVNSTREKDEGVLYDEITEIIELGEEHVYDFVVPGLHNFVAEDIVAHNTRFDELANQFGRLAGVAAPVGASVEEMTAAIATLTRQGISMDWAATSLRQTLMQLARPNKELEKVMERFGFQTGRAMVQARGFAGSLDLVRHYVEETNIPLTELFSNVRAVTAVMPLASKSYGEYVKDQGRMAEATGKSTDALEKQREAWSYQLGTIKSQLLDFGITVGGTFANAILGMLEPIKAFVVTLEWMYSAIESLMEPLGRLMGWVVAFTGSIYALTKAFIGLKAVLLATKAIMLSHPILAGLAVAATGAVALVNHFKTINREIEKAKESLEDLGVGEESEIMEQGGRNLTRIEKFINRWADEFQKLSENEDFDDIALSIRLFQKQLDETFTAFHTGLHPDRLKDLKDEIVQALLAKSLPEKFAEALIEAFEIVIEEEVMSELARGILNLQATTKGLAAGRGRTGQMAEFTRQLRTQMEVQVAILRDTTSSYSEVLDSMDEMNDIYDTTVDLEEVALNKQWEGANLLTKLVQEFQKLVDAADEFTLDDDEIRKTLREAYETGDMETFNATVKIMNERMKELETAVEIFTRLDMEEELTEAETKLRIFSDVVGVVSDEMSQQAEIIAGALNSIKDELLGLASDLIQSFFSLNEQIDRSVSSANIPRVFKVSRAAWGVAQAGQPIADEAGGEAGGSNFGDRILAIISDALVDFAWATFVDKLAWEEFIENFTWESLLAQLAGVWDKFIWPILEPVFTALASVLGGLGASIAIVVAAVATIEVAIAVLYGAFLGIKDVLVAIWEPIEKAIAKAWEILQPLIEAVRGAFAALAPVGRIIGEVIGWIIEVGAIIGSLLAPAFTFIGDVISFVADKIAWIWDHALKPVFDALAWAIGGFVNIILSVYNTLVDVANFLIPWGDPFDKVDLITLPSLQTTPQERWKVDKGGLAVVHKDETIGRGGEGNTYHYNVVLPNVQDADQFDREMQRITRLKNLRETGNRSGPYKVVNY